MKRRVFGYARVSSDDQAKGASLDAQRESIRRHAVSLGLDVDDWFVEAESGSFANLDQRAQRTRLLASIRNGDLVLVDKIDRWSRDRSVALADVKTVLAAGASFYAIAENLDPSTREGDFMLGFRSILAHEDRERIIERLVGARTRLRADGYYAEGLAPYGYERSAARGVHDREKNVLRVIDDEAKKVRKAFRLCIDGSSLSAIGQALEIGRDRAQSILASRVYLGEVKDRAGRWIKGRHKAIIDADTFVAAQRAIQSRRLGGARSRGGAETDGWLLRDVAACGMCGARMSSAFVGPHDARRYYYRCAKRCVKPTRYIRVDFVEEQGETAIAERLESLAELLAKEPKTISAAPVIDLADRRARIQRRREKNHEAFASDLMTRDELRVALGKLDAESLKLDAEEKAANRKPALADANARRSALAQVQTMRSAWKALSPAEKRAIATKLISSARMTAGKICIFQWKSPSELAGVD